MRGLNSEESNPQLPSLVSGIITTLTQFFGKKQSSLPPVLDLSQVRVEKYFDNAVRVVAILSFAEQTLFLAFIYLPQEADDQIKMIASLKLLSENPTLTPGTRMVVYETERQYTGQIWQVIGQDQLKTQVAIWTKSPVQTLFFYSPVSWQESHQ